MATAAPSREISAESGLIQARPGASLWADYFSDRELKAREKREGPTKWLLQYMVMSGLAEKRPFPLRLRDLIVYPVQRDQAPISIIWGTVDGLGRNLAIEDIESIGFGTDQFYMPMHIDDSWGPYTKTVLTVDPSGRGLDKTAWCAMSEGNGYLWCHGCDGIEGGYEPHVLQELAALAKKYNVGQIIVEDVAGFGMLAQLLEPHVRQLSSQGDAHAKAGEWMCRVDTERVSGQKEKRIVTALEQVMSSHRLIVSREVAANRTIQHQLTRITLERGSLAHDDEIDAMASAVRQFEDMLSVDPIEAAERSRHKYIREQLAEQRKMMGLRPKAASWFNYHWRK